MPMPAHTLGMMVAIIAVDGFPSQSTGFCPKRASNWLSNPFSVELYINFHSSTMTNPLVNCGRKKTERQKTLPRGTSESSEREQNRRQEDEAQVERHEFNGLPNGDVEIRVQKNPDEVVQPHPGGFSHDVVILEGHLDAAQQRIISP